MQKKSNSNTYFQPHPSFPQISTNSIAYLPKQFTSWTPTHHPAILKWF